VRMLMRQGLEAYGYQCQEAANGIEGLRQIKNCNFDVVLTDLNLPFLDGLGLAQYMREDSSLGNPIFLLTISNHTNMIVSLAEAFGIHKVLVKPCHPSEVDTIIRQQLNRFPLAA